MFEQKGRRVAHAGLAIVLGVAGAVITGASPAAASVPGLVRVSADSANDATSIKSATATCPTGKQVTGTGYELTGATGDVTVHRLFPGTRSVSVAAALTDGATGNWKITAYAICADPLPGRVLVQAGGATDSADFKSSTATCPAGKTLLGTGYVISGPVGEVVVDDLVPNGNENTAPTSVRVGAYEADATTANWSVNGYAVCANPLPGQSRATNVSSSDPSDFKSLSVTCQTSDALTGIGFLMNGATGEALVDDFVPSGSTTTPPASALMTAYEEDPIATNWSLRPYAICASR